MAAKLYECHPYDRKMSDIHLMLINLYHSSAIIEISFDSASALEASDL